MAENNDPPATPVPGSRTPNSLPRRHISAERQHGQPPVGELQNQLATLVDSVMVLANHIGGESASAVEPPTDRSGRRVKKFQRTGTIEDRTAPIPGSGETTEPRHSPDTVSAVPPLPSGEREKHAAAAINKNVAWPRLATAEPETEDLAPKVRSQRKRPNKRIVLLAVQVAGLILLGLGFFVGRTSVTPAEGDGDQGEKLAIAKAPDGGGMSRANEKVLAIANDALRAARNGDAEAARKLYADALDSQVDLPGIHYQLARLAIESGDLLGADLSLDHSSNAGEFTAAASYSRARFAAMKGNYTEVVRQLQSAAYNEPFSGRYFFYWGEGLRRSGKTQRAVEILGRALDRPHTAEEAALYLFKSRLAKVEAGDDGAFNAELDEHLKHENVPPEWWLLAAARDITRTAFPAAAESLKKAAALLPPATYALQVKDYLFQAVRSEPVLSSLLNHPLIPDSTESNGPFPDPVGLSPALADPAIWSVATAQNKPAS